MGNYSLAAGFTPPPCEEVADNFSNDIMADDSSPQYVTWRKGRSIRSEHLRKHINSLCVIERYSRIEYSCPFWIDAEAACNHQESLCLASRILDKELSGRVM